VLDEEGAVRNMALLRMVAGCIEMCAALAMLRYNRVTAALRINAVLGLVGPVILLLVSAIGLSGLVGRLPASRIVAVGAAVVLIFAATR